MLIFGAAMVIMMIFRPSGILPPLPRIYKLHKEHRRESES
jgi:branched-chain amino acid transport system permease protein